MKKRTTTAKKAKAATSDLVWVRTTDGRWTQRRRDDVAREAEAKEDPAVREARRRSAATLLAFVDFAVAAFDAGPKGDAILAALAKATIDGRI